MILIILIVVRMIKITTVKFVIIIFIIVAVVSIFRSLVSGVLTWFMPVLRKLTSLARPEKRQQAFGLSVFKIAVDNIRHHRGDRL